MGSERRCGKTSYLRRSKTDGVCRHLGVVDLGVEGDGGQRHVEDLTPTQLHTPTQRGTGQAKSCCLTRDEQIRSSLCARLRQAWGMV